MYNKYFKNHIWIHQYHIHEYNLIHKIGCTYKINNFPEEIIR